MLSDTCCPAWLPLHNHLHGAELTHAGQHSLPHITAAPNVAIARAQQQRAAASSPGYQQVGRAGRRRGGTLSPTHSPQPATVRPMQPHWSRLAAPTSCFAWLPSWNAHVCSLASGKFEMKGGTLGGPSTAGSSPLACKCWHTVAHRKEHASVQQTFEMRWQPEQRMQMMGISPVGGHTGGCSVQERSFGWEAGLAGQGGLKMHRERGKRQIRNA